MLVLAIDTSAKVSSVALARDKTLLAISTLNTGNTHSETLLSSVNNLLEISGVNVSDIDLFAVSNGPGSFTGIRIGVSFVKGIAFGNNKCIGVSTLEALAYNLADREGVICAVMDARRNQVYNALFSCQNGILTRLCDDRLISLEELDKELSAIDEDVFLVGDGYDVALSRLSLDKIKPISEINRYQNAYSVALCAINSLESGKDVQNDQTLLPTYLRAPQAERERLAKLNNETVTD